MGPFEWSPTQCDQMSEQKVAKLFFKKLPKSNLKRFNLKSGVFQTSPKGQQIFGLLM